VRKEKGESIQRLRGRSRCHPKKGGIGCALSWRQGGRVDEGNRDVSSRGGKKKAYDKRSAAYNGGGGVKISEGKVIQLGETARKAEGFCSAEGKGPPYRQYWRRKRHIKGQAGRSRSKTTEDEDHGLSEEGAPIGPALTTKGPTATRKKSRPKKKFGLKQAGRHPKRKLKQGPMFTDIGEKQIFSSED